MKAFGTATAPKSESCVVNLLSEFMVDAARRAAEEPLLDQTLIRVDTEIFVQFTEVLRLSSLWRGL
jgi:uncharacterized protein (DUF1778 family)